MAVRAGGTGLRRAAVVILLSVSAVLFTGCGAPEFTYVTNSADRTYLKIPNSWRPIDQKALDEAVGLDPAMTGDRGVWLVGYDADAAPSTMHLFGQQAASPVALVVVQDIPAASRGQFSLDRLRDVFYPVSPTAREKAAAGPASSLADFALITDKVLTPGDGLRGVHAVFRYRMGAGPLQIFDQTAYLNDDASKLYLVLVRCSTQCYQDRQREIDSVVSSFTVRETS